MVLETISTLFSTLGTAADTTKAFKELLHNNRGEPRLLLEELKKNATLCWLVVEREVEPQTAVEKMSVAVYDRLLEKGFDFNRLSPGKHRIRRVARLEDSDLASFLGNDVARLVESIYDRIKEMQLVYQVDPDNERIDWNRRVLNLHKRILLLMSHLRGWSE
ncbi:MAG TPA: hypothetical protein VGJ22_13005 [Anaerolineales bacterium]|jgi:hypothetical protein